MLAFIVLSFMRVSLRMAPAYFTRAVYRMIYYETIRTTWLVALLPAVKTTALLLLRRLLLLQRLVAGERPAAETPAAASTMVLRRGHDSSSH